MERLKNNGCIGEFYLVYVEFEKNTFFNMLTRHGACLSLVKETEFSRFYTCIFLFS